MGAFSPDPTASPSSLANWLFVRLVVLVGATVYAVGIASGFAGQFGPFPGFVARTLVFLLALWIALQLLFEAIGALVATGS